MRRLSVWLAPAFVLVHASMLPAWGPGGHEVVARIAEHRLSPLAREFVGRHLAEGESLASVANWADDVRPARPETAGWHYVNVPAEGGGYVLIATAPMATASSRTCSG